MTCVGRKGSAHLLEHKSSFRLNFIGVTEQASGCRKRGVKIKRKDPNKTTADESNHFICTCHSRPRANLGPRFKAGSSFPIYENSFPYSPPSGRNVGGTCHAILNQTERMDGSRQALTYQIFDFSRILFSFSSNFGILDYGRIYGSFND